MITLLIIFMILYAIVESIILTFYVKNYFLQKRYMEGVIRSSMIAKDNIIYKLEKENTYLHGQITKGKTIKDCFDEAMKSGL